MRGGFEHRRGRGSAARGYPVRGRTPHLSPPRGRTPFSDIKQSLDSNNDTEWTAPSTHSRFKHKRGRGSAARGGYPVRGRTPFSDTTQFQYSNDDTEIWEMEDIENIDNNLGNDQSDNWNDQPIPLMDIKITFNVNNSSSSHRYDSAKGNRKVRSVRHLTKPFRGRGDYTHSRGRPPVSSWSAPSVHSGGFEHKGGRWSAPRGGCSEWGRIPLLRTPTEKAPCFTNPRERTPFRHMRWCQQMAIDHSYLPIYM
ncbi:uncharacterized protein LOC121377319 [Gigantopelta aegis]|uniref:uncharacterized protein LOC121377319 n=1 Tax=Gigantopelta aegis TaxID=1735272 RepID=UPI001B88ACA6|nr:uncharacterized protein LOC121377319 [Gigantopelta aegis]